MTTTTRSNRLPRADTVIIVHDGATRWVGNRREVYDWLSSHGHRRGWDRASNLPNAVVLDADAYQEMCDSVSYRGRYDHLIGHDMDTLRDRGAPELYVQ